MGLKSFYYKQEEKYFRFLDRLEKKGINLYKIVDPLEKKGIPTFLVFNLIILFLIIFLVFLFTGTPSLTDESYSLKFVDSLNNPIENESIRILFNNDEKILETDALGIATVSGIKKEEFILSLNSDKYIIEKPSTINFKEKNQDTIYLKAKVELLSKTIYFKSNNELYTSQLTVSNISCTNNDSYSKNNLPVSDGFLELSDIPYDCGYLEILVESPTVNALGSLEVNEDNESGEVNLSLQAQKTGNATIRVLDKDLKTPVANISLSIVNMQSQIVREGTTNTNGIVSFNDILIGTYKLVLYDNDDRYKPISELENIQITIVDSAMQEREVLLEKAYIGKLIFKVIDSKTKEEIPNVSVSLYKSDTLIKTTPTDKEGFVSFGVEENIAYKAVFNNQNYILRTENNLKISESVRQIQLTPITSENIRSLIVTVQDTLLKPVDFATIRLWDEQENIIVQTITSDIYGKATLNNLDPNKSYKLDATKGKFSSEYTNPFRITEQEINEQTIRMVIGEGTFNISLISEFGEPHQGNIYVYDASNDLVLSDKTTSTNQEGFTLIKIRADKQVYFVIDNFDSKLITPMYEINAEEIKNLEFTLPRTTQTSSIDFIGFYNSLGEKVNSVSPGQMVTGRYVLNVSKKFSKAVAHIRTGDAPSPACSTRSYNVSEDSAFIREVRFSKSNFLGSTTYTPCTGQSIDLSNKALRNAKWFNLTINTPMEGSYLIETDIVVLDNAFTDQSVNYRAEFYEGAGVIRSPIDTSFTNDQTKQPLYAQAKQVKLFTGSQNQCTSFLCSSFIITNLQTNLSRNIIDNYNAQINNNYRLSFNFNVLEGKVAPNSMLVVSSGSSIKLNDYLINSVTGNLLSGDDFSGIEIGSLTSNDFLSGEINFNIVDDVSDVLTISLISEGQEVFSKNIYIDIKEAKNLSIEIVPRKIVPFIFNDVMLSITDDTNSSVASANVNVLLNNNTIVTGLTDSQGLFGFNLPAPDLSDVLRIIVSKNEYKTGELNIVVDDKLIVPIPQEIDLTLDSSRDVRDIYNFSLLNESFVPLSIVSITQTTQNEYVDVALNIDDYTINPLSQTDIELSATLTEKGINLYTQQNVKTELLVRVRSEEMDKTWVITIPVSIRIVLGNQLDSVDCLKVMPTEGSLRTKPDGEVTFDFTLENKCTSRQVAVDLGSIFAIADWQNKQEAGVFSIVVSGKEYLLENLEETQILSTLNKNSKSTLQLKFKAHKINSLTETPIIYFKSTKGNISGVDEVLTKLPIALYVNNYSECLEIPKQPVPVLGCNWFSGFGMYNQHHGGSNFVQNYNMNRQFNPYNQYQSGPGYFNQQQGYNPQYNMMPQQSGYVGQQMSTVNPYNFPTAQYQNQFGNYNYNDFMSGYPQGNFGNMNMTNTMNCLARPFYVKNNCSEAVDVRLDPNYGINVTSDKEFTLEPGDSQEVLIMGGEEMGSFNIPVNAKPSLASNLNYSLIGNVPVNVTLPISFMPSKCIQVTPQKLNFSNILDPKYQVVKVMNTCFDQGYRLVEVNYLDLVDLEFDGVSFLNVGDMQGKIQPIKVDYLTDLQTHKPIEVWEIALRRNPEIKNTPTAKQYLQEHGSRIAGIVTTFRKMLIDIEDAVNLKFVLQVGLQPPHGQASLIYHNVGMELKDNFQWLILDRQDNWDLVKDFMGKDINYSLFTDDELIFVDTDVKLSYKLEINKEGRHIVFIKVPEKELTENKFREIDLEGTAQRCFMGMIKDFPIEGLKESSHVQDLGVYYLDEDYTKPLEVSLEFIRKHYFKLCFERPITEINNYRRSILNNKLEIYDYFREKQFAIWAIDETSQKSYLQGHTYIGVDTTIGTRSLDEEYPDEDPKDKDPTKDPDKTEPGKEKDVSCLLPDGVTSGNGLTGEGSYKNNGLDKIFFKYGSDNITKTTCEDYYCDHEQFFDYIQKRANDLDNSTNITLGEVSFIVEDNKIKENTTIELKDYCALCNSFEGKETIESYIDGAKNILSKIDEDVRKITIIKTKVSDLTENNSVKTINNYQYMRVDYFLENYDSFNLSIKQKIEFYENLEVYVGDSVNILQVNLRKFFSESYSKEVLENYKAKTSVMNKYNLDYSQEENNMEPGTYTVKLNKTGDDVSIEVQKSKGSLDSEYKNNVLFYQPINPLFLKSNQVILAPFIDSDYKKLGYEVFNLDIQKGYIFKLSPDIIVETSGQNETEVLNHYFIDSRPFYFNRSYDVKIVSPSENNKELASRNAKNLFLLTSSNNLALYTNPQIENEKNQTVFSKTNPVDNYMIYNINMNNYKPSITYNTIYDVFEQIKEENVCFNVTNKEIKLWHNPSKFK
jgi:hypothetical protein